jgi:hypothetical protein
MDRYDRLFVVTAFSIQGVLLIYFAIRKWNYEAAMRWGWIVFALAIPAVIVSLIILRAGSPWYLWLGGFIYGAWAVFGYFVDIARPVSWRSPIYWPVWIPYVGLYMSGLMLYWWPLGTIQRRLWFIYAGLFVISTILNVTSHGW